MVRVPDGMEALVKCASEFASRKPPAMRGDGDAFRVFFNGADQKIGVVLHLLTGAYDIYEPVFVHSDGSTVRSNVVLKKGDTDALKAFIKAHLPDKRK